MLCFNYQISQSLSHRNIDICSSNFIFSCCLQQFIIRVNTSFRLCLTCFRIFSNPLKLISKSTLTSRFFFFLLFKTFSLLLKPRRIITLIRYALPAIKLQNPTCYIIQKITIVSNHNDCTVIILKMLFKPRNRFGIQMISRLVKQQQIRFLQQQPA